MDKPGDTSVPREFFSVSPLLLFPQTLGRFSVYLRQNGRFVLYTGAEERFTERHRTTLHENGVSEVFVQANEREIFDGYVEDNLGAVLMDENVPLAERSKVLYGASLAVMRDAFEERLPEGLAARLYGRMTRLVSASVRFLALGEGFKAVAPFIAHDYKTYSHCVHVFLYVTSVLQGLGLEREALFGYGLGALMHDLGKARIPRTILNKPGRLTDEERAVVNTHPLQGVSMCTNVELRQETFNCILFHHEKVDGSGYPSGMSGRDLPFPVRVLTVCDVYDALTTDRPYAAAMRPFEALKLMREGIGGLDAEAYRLLVAVLSGADIQVEPPAPRAAKATSAVPHQKPRRPA
ncbi:MAG: HD domain-containing protein [Desulfovibrionaceae bacterium]|jgi:HD-GYP domain-containing protein (c-di-GMP phosphodiesterase class II)|nr:HD domain-containing protein [Desulfovibrionaceae bacterium]